MDTRSALANGWCQSQYSCRELSHGFGAILWDISFLMAANKAHRLEETEPALHLSALTIEDPLHNVKLNLHNPARGRAEPLARFLQRAATSTPNQIRVRAHHRAQPAKVVCHLAQTEWSGSVEP